MSARVIDGKAVAAAVRERVAGEVASCGPAASIRASRRFWWATTPPRTSTCG